MGLLSYRRRAPPTRPAELIGKLPAPMGSINTISSGAAMPPEDCIYRWNMIPAEYGVRVRLGSREWCTNLDGAVYTLMPFTASQSANDKLFATTATGIWDVTSSSASPTRVIAFGTSDSTSGWGVSTVMVTSGGHYLLYTDETNGLYVWNEGGSWTKYTTTQITGADPVNFVSVMTWKNRVWFVEKNTARAWYLPVNAISGTVSSHYFGAKFPHGGDLRGLWSWTGDAGTGIDDQLVAISGGGDVVIYQGTDPATVGLFALRGYWFIGGVPVGRKLCTESGGDLLIMSSLGILRASSLVQGGVEGGFEASRYETYKIGNLFNYKQIATRNVRGWQMVIHPQDNTLMVLVPVAAGVASEQLAMALWNKGWSQYRDMPMGQCAEAFQGTLYFGTADGRVCIMDGYKDGVTLADPNSYTAIEYSLLTGFSDFGSPVQKQINQIRANFLAQGATSPYAIRARYGWDITDVPVTPDQASDPGSSLWDTALWDTAVWGPEYVPSATTTGVTGMGPQAAIALRGTAAVRTVLIGFHVTYKAGGFL